MDAWKRRIRRRPTLALPLLLLLLTASTGCFHQRAFPMLPADRVAALLAQSTVSPAQSTVSWLEATHQQLADALPNGHTPALLTEDLRRQPPADIYPHFGRNPARLTSIFFNLSGLLSTAQVTQRSHRSENEVPTWDGFEEIWVPVSDDLQLAGRIGLAQDGGRPRVSDCVVLIPGLLGDMGLWRTRDIAHALRDSGLHVLALELRGCGRTAARYPNTPYCYGLREVGDLLAVAEWLQAKSYVNRTGLIGFSWGANQALLLAWEESRRADDPAVAPRLQPFMRPLPRERCFQAGVIAFSPVIGFQDLVEQLRQNWSLLANPVLNRMQAGLRQRWQGRGARPSSGDLGQLVEFELREAGVDYPGVMQDAWEYLRVLPSSDPTEPHKLSRARIPVLVVQAANDPLGSAQRVGELFRRLDNPMVAGLILPGGGHNGFAHYSRSYFYGLLLNFFSAPQLQS